MTIYDFITAHPDDHIRIISYTPAPDKLDEYGNLYCDEEGKSETVFDSTTGEGDLAPDLMLKELTTISECTTSDGKPVYELEYVPDEYYFLY